MLRNIGVLILMMIFPFYCSGAEPRNSGLEVTVSIPPQKGLVEALGGSRVRVSVMVPYGADPHSYELRPKQLKGLAASSIYVKVGTPIEFEIAWMDKLRKLNPEMLVVDMSKGIGLLRVGKTEEGHHGHDDGEKFMFDPHVWLSPENLKVCAQNVLEGLIRIDPSGKDYYAANGKDYLKRLDALDSEMKKTVLRFKIKRFIVFHPSFGYFARDYGLTQIPVQVKGKDPTGKWLKEMIDLAKRENIRTVFASPQFSTSSAETIARQINGKVAMIDPLAEDLVDNLKNIAKAMESSMR